MKRDGARRELKLFGYINVSRELYARMQARATGVIVNVIGMAAEKPNFDYICGSTANAGLAAFTKALGKGGGAARRAGARRSPTRDANRAHLEGPFAGLIDPEQVANMVVFLASPRCAQVSGVVMNLGA